MSLVLLSNDNSTVEFEGGGIAQANSWTNVLQTPMIIPKNSEVALQSLRVNKAATTAIDISNSKFYTYIGQGRDGSGNLPDEPKEDTRMVAPAQLVHGDYTAQSFVDKSLLPALREAVFHPDYQDRINASVQETTTGDFEGYNIKFGEGDTPPSDVFPADDEFVVAGYQYDELTDDFTWTNSNKRFTKGTDPLKRGYGIATRYPMSVRQAKHVANFANAGETWAIGLSRYADAREGVVPGTAPGQFAIPTWAEEVEGDWYDFGVIRDVDDKLRIYHAVVDSDGNRKLKPKEVVYYGYTGASSTDPYDLDTNASGFSEVEFFLDGEQVEVYLRKAGGGGRTLICSPDLGTPEKVNYIKPINISCQYLYPKYEVTDDNAYITMVNHEGVDVQNFQYNGVDILNDDKLTFQDFYVTAAIGATYETSNRVNNILDQCREADIFGVYNDFTPDHIDDEHVFLKYSVSLPKIALIVAPDPTYYRPSNRANAAGVLGFEGETVVDNPTQTTGFKTFTSHETPKNLVKNSMFVRLTSLTQKSSNGYTGNDSKILYHCPRFDSAGRDSGELYYEPAEKTYLDISNPGDIQVNSFSVDFVTRDEVLINGMMGNSTVMLHIREKK